MPSTRKSPSMTTKARSSSLAGRKRKVAASSTETSPKRVAVASPAAALARNKPAKHSNTKEECQPTVVVRTLGDDNNWQSFFFRFAVYKQRHDGDSNPSPQDMDPNIAQLGHWVKRQRSKKGKAELTLDQIDALDAIGFSWNPRMDVMNREWEKRFQELVEFKRRHGHCRVPTSHNKDPVGLGAWVSRQRDAQQLYERLQQESGKSHPKKDNRKAIHNKESQQCCRVMTQEHREKLESIGFVWTIFHRSGFDGKVAELQEYKEKYGNCNVPQHWTENKSLGKFVARQRYYYCLLQQGKTDKNPLTVERIAKLDELGFSWGKVRPNTWKDPKTENAKEKAEEARVKAHAGLVSGAQKSVLNMGDPAAQRNKNSADTDDEEEEDASCSDD